MPRLRLTIAYTGTAYHGWQIQIRKDKYLPTVQALLERSLHKITGQKVHVHAAGRTDAGVHARAQVAHADVPDSLAHMDWQLALNTSLPKDIRIMDACLVADSFHAQFDAISKRYTYRLWLSRRCTPPWLAPYVWACGPVHVEAMDEAAQLLCGTHDFASLQNRGTDIKTTIRTVESITRDPNGPIANTDANIELAWTFCANGFLKQMVRNMMGLLVTVGRGKLPPSAVTDILTTCDRRHAGITAPAHGLTLTEVLYLSGC